MRELQLSRGQTALVNNCYFAYLNQWKWHALKSGKTFYAVRNIRRDGKRTLLYLHVFLAEHIGLSTAGDIDHKNRNGLDNRRCNLRPATRSQNGSNRMVISRRRYKGVTWNKRDKRWVARLAINKVTILRKMFTSEIEAARAYNKAARKYHGKFAVLNKIKD